MTQPTMGAEPPSPPPESLPVPPGSSGLPLLGETLAFVRSPRDFIGERRRRYGDVFRSNVLGASTVFLIGPDANQWVFAGEGKYLQNQWNYAIRQLLGARCVAMLNGSEHRDRRRLMTPHFGYAEMRGFVPTIEAIARRHLERWADQPGVLTVWPAMRELAFEIALALIFSDAKFDLARVGHLFRAWTAGMFSPVPIGLPFTTFGRALKAKQALLVLLDGLVSERMQRAEQPADILGSLINSRDGEGRPLSRETIVDELLLQLFAGHDTTVTASSNLMLQLARSPEVVERGRQELRSAAAGPLTLEGLKAMPFLHHVINEGMRCVPPIAGAFRVTTRDVSYGGYTIPRGWTVAFSMVGTHGDPASWPGPDRFDPDRFEGSGHKAKPGAFIPFGGGPRVCLGQHFAMVEMSVVLALLLRGYRWELVPGQDLDYRYLPFPQPKSGIQLRFSRLPA